MILVVSYLAAIVTANLLVSALGPASVLPIAFLFIGFDLVCRDVLHDAWRTGLKWKMSGLILVGGLLTYLINVDARQIAIASTVAFASAGLADTIIYHLLRHRPRLFRMNVSNVAAALVDSVLFLTIAFGWSPVILSLVVAQWGVKVLGGGIWSLAVTRKLNPA
jgi:uncharacterized PurR-regulated membrane protein YhhQ (DUF165 family)